MTGEELGEIAVVVAQIRANVEQMPAVFAEALRPVAVEMVRLRAVEAALYRLARVGGEFSANMAGPHWEELCAALSEARAALRS